MCWAFAHTLAATPVHCCALACQGLDRPGWDVAHSCCKVRTVFGAILCNKKVKHTSCKPQDGVVAAAAGATGSLVASVPDAATRGRYAIRPTAVTDIDALTKHTPTIGCHYIMLSTRGALLGSSACSS